MLGFRESKALRKLTKRRGPKSPPIRSDPGAILALLETYPLFTDHRLFKARECGLKEFPQYCETHGLTLFRSTTGRCSECSKADPFLCASEARYFGRKAFRSFCVRCSNATDHSVARGRCLDCFDAAGRLRSSTTAPNPARIEARRAGSKTFLDVCGKHGVTAHHTGRGLCLGCYTASGTPRSHRANEPARGEARRSGAKTYAGTCDRCGPSPHHTASGTCAFCCTVNGAPRRSGAWIYLAQRPA